MSDQLQALGIGLIEGYDAAQLDLKPDLWVIGNVVKRGMPLMEAILDAGLPYTSGPQWLSEHILQGRHVLAVAGTHGKTTTTSMLSWILEHAGLKPGFLVGGVPFNFGVSARLGEGQTFVIEADEYDTAFFDKRSKFVHYRPRTAILNNLEFDHADIFDNLAAIERQFHHLVRTVPASGRVVVQAGQDSLDRVMQMGCWSEQVRFGSEGWTAQGPADAFDVWKDGQVVGHVAWALSGLHNQMNALAAIAAAEHVGVTPDQACQALAQFKNVRRRFEIVGTVNTGHSSAPITIYDDFAHHPTAIATTVHGLRVKLKPGERILAAFEPRSNTMKLGVMAALLPQSLAEADLAFCHAAGLNWDVEAALAPMGVGPGKKAQISYSVEELMTQLSAVAQPGDHILCMSNGSFGGLHTKLLHALQNQYAAITS